MKYVWSIHCWVVAQSCLTLCDPMDCRLPGSSVHGILQARILEWVAISSSRGYSQPRDETHVSCVSCMGRQILYHWVTMLEIDYNLEIKEKQKIMTYPC